MRESVIFGSTSREFYLIADHREWIAMEGNETFLQKKFGGEFRCSSLTSGAPFQM